VIPFVGMFDYSCIEPRLLRSLWMCGEALCAHLEKCERSMADPETRALVENNARVLERKLEQAREKAAALRAAAPESDRAGKNRSLDLALASAADFARRLRQLLTDYEIDGDPKGEILVEVASVAIEMMTLNHAEQLVASLPGGAA
jgi:hypothetical protein